MCCHAVALSQLTYNPCSAGSLHHPGNSQRPASRTLSSGVGARPMNRLPGMVGSSSTKSNGPGFAVFVEGQGEEAQGSRVPDPLGRNAPPASQAGWKQLPGQRVQSKENRMQATVWRGNKVWRRNSLFTWCPFLDAPHPFSFPRWWIFSCRHLPRCLHLWCEQSAADKGVAQPFVSNAEKSDFAIFVDECEQGRDSPEESTCSLRSPTHSLRELEREAVL